MTMLAIEPRARRRALDTHRRSRAGPRCDRRGYIDQISVTAAAGTVTSVDVALRLFASWIIDHDPAVVSLRQVNRRHIEPFKLWLATRENQRGQPLKKSTINLRLSMLRVVIERLIEWDHPDTPRRNPIIWSDLPKIDEPLPKFLDDDQAAKFMAAAVRLDPQRRLIVELLARTGLRVTEFCELTDDAIVTMNETKWLRVPVGKLHTDRYVPLLRHWSSCIADWLDWNGPNDTGRLISNKGRPFNRTVVSRIVKRLRHHRRDRPRPPPPTPSHARDAVDQQRHEPRSHRPMLGHRSMRMTLVYARIADRTVAEEYFAAADRVDQLYTTHLTTSPA